MGNTVDTIKKMAGFSKEEEKVEEKQEEPVVVEVDKPVEVIEEKPDDDFEEKVEEIKEAVELTLLQKAIEKFK